MNKSRLLPIILLSSIFFSYISACNKPINQTITTQSVTAEKPSSAVKDTAIIPLDKFEYRFYSPNKKNYISEKLTLNEVETELPCETKLYYQNKFIDSASYYQGNEEKQLITHAIWLNDQNILIKGTYIYNIEKVSKEPILFPVSFLSSHYLLNYRLSPGKNYIAYIAITHPDSPNNYCTLSVMLYDLIKNTWQTVYNKEITWGVDWEYDNSGVQIFWDTQDNVYFSYEVVHQYMQVVRYNVINGDIKKLNSQYALWDSSPDGKYFIVYKDLKVYVIESSTEKYIGDIQSTKGVPKYPWAWSQDNPWELAMIIHDNNGLEDKNKAKTFHIEIFSMKEGKVIRIIKDDRFTYSQSKKWDLTWIDYYDGGYVVSTGDKTFMIKC